MSPTVSPMIDSLRTYLPRTRWFGGKGRDFQVAGVETVGVVPGGALEPGQAGGPLVVIHLVEVRYTDAAGGSGGPASPGAGSAGQSELYQVPLVYYTEPEGRLDHAFVGWWEDPEHGWVHAYDALHDREAMALWLRCFDQASDNRIDAGSSLAFHRLPGHPLDLETHSTLFAGEQSNSSVAYGEDAVMKVFRKVTPGVNPDIQVHEVLTNAGSTHVAHLYGWLDVVIGDPTGVEDPADRPVLQLAMLQQFLRTATDGWDLALSSVRTLFADPDVHAAASGGDFAGEAARLGEAVAKVHAQLAELFPSEQRGPEAAVALADAMDQRLTEALDIVPGLAEHAARLRGVYDAVRSLPGLEVQRVHGDLHLGQTLRTAKGWKIVDFEGEPAKPLSERLLPDSRWRDVAGMLRSFDYAPRVVLHDASPTVGANVTSVPGSPTDTSPGDVPAATDDPLTTRAAEWAHRARNHFVNAYAGDLTREQHVLLDAYVADKAVYETVYETRNRPTWVAIPLEALARIGGAA